MKLHPNLRVVSPHTSKQIICNTVENVKQLNRAFKESFSYNSAENILVSECAHPQEIHPYLERYLNKMPKDITGIIIGTFPPASYMLSELNNKHYGLKQIIVNNTILSKPPYIDFFHGNRNSFWNLLDIGNEISIKAIISFLRKNKWTYSDIIYSCSRNKISDTKDSALQNVVPNFALIDEIMENTNITHLWFTSSSTFNSIGVELLNNGSVKVSNGQAYNIFLRSLQIKGCNLQLGLCKDKFIKLSPNFKYFKHTTCHYLKINKRIFTVYTGPSPSNGASISISRNSHYMNWINLENQNKHRFPPTIEYRKDVYRNFVNRSASC